MMVGVLNSENSHNNLDYNNNPVGRIEVIVLTRFLQSQFVPAHA
jgi:hypothetical protein